MQLYIIGVRGGEGGWEAASKIELCFFFGQKGKNSGKTKKLKKFPYAYVHGHGNGIEYQTLDILFNHLVNQTANKLIIIYNLIQY